MRDVAQFLKVLGDEARLQILWLLFNHDELCVCDMMEALGITQSKASRHLATLRHAGLVVDRRDGAWSYYSLSPAKTGLERAVLQSLRRELGRHPDANRLTKDLKQWLARKERSAACSAPEPTQSKSSGKPGARTRAAAVLPNNSKSQPNWPSIAPGRHVSETG
ncbi:MAG: metalloregulator ArsR/SmtB family transcription factor [Polyangiaceae bacterium]|nr:metalloregulator ArsR/SmtB family transcription factor [Polyangiaceae bacterium]